MCECGPVPSVSVEIRGPSWQLGFFPSTSFFEADSVLFFLPCCIPNINCPASFQEVLLFLLLILPKGVLGL